jgi:hypothetical protein
MHSHPNPYQAPSDATGAEGDLLKGPAVAVLVVSILAIAGSVIPLVASMVLWRIVIDLDRPDLERDVRDGLIASGLSFAFGVTGIIVHVALKMRRQRWLAIVWSIAAIASFILAPLGVFLLMRLWRKDVWTSFARAAAR